MEFLPFAKMIGCLMMTSLITCLSQVGNENVSVPLSEMTNATGTMTSLFQRDTLIFHSTLSNSKRSQNDDSVVRNDSANEWPRNADVTDAGNDQPISDRDYVNTDITSVGGVDVAEGHAITSRKHTKRMEYSGSAAGNVNNESAINERHRRVPFVGEKSLYMINVTAYDVHIEQRTTSTPGYEASPRGALIRNAKGRDSGVDGLGVGSEPSKRSSRKTPFLLDLGDNETLMGAVTPPAVGSRPFLLDNASPDLTLTGISPLAIPRPNTSHSRPERDKLRKLYIGGLFELSGSYIYGRSELEAANMAIKHINRQRFVPGYELVLLPNDTRGDPGYGADAFYHFVYCRPQLVMLLGTSMSEVAKTLAEIVGYWNLLLVSHAATSPALSEREKYPTFYRLAPADSSYNAARKTFLQYFRWKAVAALHEDVETFTLAMDDMNKEFDKENITVKASLTFRTTGDDLQDKLKELKDEDARIIIGSFRENTARHVFCQAYHQGMYGQRYVWMLSGSYRDNWWLEGSGDTNCTHAQLSEAVNGYFSVSSMNRILGTERSISGYTTEEFLAEYESLNVTSPRSTNAQLTYDSVWAIALTLHKTMANWRRSRGRTARYRLEDFDYVTGTRMKNAFLRTMGDLDFIGVSGHISFDGPDRQSVIVIEQNQGGQQRKVGMFNPENATLDMHCFDCQDVVWPDGHVPADQFTKVVRLEFIQPEAFYTVSAVACFGIYLAIVFLSFNLHHRKLRYIKLSSPKLNNVAVAGCILVYLAVILLGMDDAILEHEAFPYVCTARAFLLSAGFSLAFGAMFTKTYRVHQIFRGCPSGLVKNKMLKDKQLLIMIIALLILDAVIISLWITIDPMDRTLTNFTIEPSPEHKDLLIIPQLSKCHSRHMTKWTGVMYAYKGLLLLFGVYMAWETRHVKISALNDSRYIGLNIYNVVLSSVTVVALSNVISDRPTLSYSLVAALIILSTTIMLCLLFLPKIYAIIKHNGAPVVATSGLTVEANTRRFVVDEKRELYYRAEVQNRVYKRELIELDQEITRLERILEVTNATVYDDFLSLIDGKTTGGDGSPTAEHQVQRRDPDYDNSGDVTGVPEPHPVTFGRRRFPETAEANVTAQAPESGELSPTTVQTSGSHYKDGHYNGSYTGRYDEHYDEHYDERYDDRYLAPGVETPRGQTPHDNVKHASANTNPRRHNGHEGDDEEMTSLLYNDVTTASDTSPPTSSLKSRCSENANENNCDSGAATRTTLDIVGATPPSGGDQRNDRIPGSYDEPSSPEVEPPASDDPSRKPEAKKSHRLAKERADALKRELARIQQELKSLGELELEVSYV